MENLNGNGNGESTKAKICSWLKLHQNNGSHQGSSGNNSRTANVLVTSTSHRTQTTPTQSISQRSTRSLPSGEGGTSVSRRKIQSSLIATTATTAVDDDDDDEKNYTQTAGTRIATVTTNQQQQQQNHQHQSVSRRVNFGQNRNGNLDADSDGGRRQKYLTAKYGSHQMALIRKRLQVEMWMYDRLNELFSQEEIEIDLDEMMDLDDEAGRRHYLKETLADFKPTSDVNQQKFITDLLGQVKTL